MVYHSIHYRASEGSANVLDDFSGFPVIILVLKELIDLEIFVKRAYS